MLCMLLLEETRHLLCHGKGWDGITNARQAGVLCTALHARVLAWALTTCSQNSCNATDVTLAFCQYGRLHDSLFRD